jgi:quinol monooxygenase YgiN
LHKQSTGVGALPVIESLLVIYELVHLTVDPERRAEFVEVYRQAWSEAAFEGSHQGKILPCIEDPGKLLVIIEWDSIAAHRQHRQTPKHNHFRAAINPYMKDWQVQHYEVEELIS